MREKRNENLSQDELIRQIELVREKDANKRNKGKNRKKEWKSGLIRQILVEWVRGKDDKSLSDNDGRTDGWTDGQTRF